MKRAHKFEQILTGALRKAGMKRDAARGGNRADLVFEKEGRRYLIELKALSEGRGDRLIPLLSQAILQARMNAQEREGTIPVAVVAAPRIPPTVADQIREFAARYAPDAGVGVIDEEGLRSFTGLGLEHLDAKPTHTRREVARTSRLPDLFSDLNQWMLKILIGQRLPENLISVPRVPIHNASQLAGVAGVSVMSASRLVRHLSERGFLEKKDEILQIIRTEELLELWLSANRDEAEEIPARWIIRKGAGQLESALRRYPKPHGGPRCCLALFAAADELGYGFVQGAPLHIYVESLTLDALARLGLMIDRSGRQPDVYLRRPSNREGVFRARVNHDGIPVSDILQIWLDVSTHPARGREQAREIWRRVLKPLSAERA
ncbi:MAG TPA: hypothetical protein VHA14_12655 [Bryobacteraceae bacterium]|nr:hypothetical protein [Bryobacteraceae bacterium]